MKKHTSILLSLILLSTSVLAKELTIEQTYKTKGLKAVEEIMMTEISRRTNVFYKKVEMCNPESLNIALEILNKSVNASVLPGIELILHKAIKVCPEKMLSIIPESKLEIICLAYEYTAEDNIVNKKEVEFHYSRVTAALKKVKTPKLKEKANFCIKSLHSDT